MGSGQSSSHGPLSDPTLQNPFPVSPHLSSDLDRLSFVAARVLNTPDIYNIANLSKLDVCGDYAVFLKQQIKDDLLHSSVKTLKPLSVKIPEKEGESGVEEILYQDVSTLKKETREKICSELADTMVKVISIIIACLASIQVAAPSREVIMRQVTPQPPPEKQKGGSSDHQDPSNLVLRGGDPSEIELRLSLLVIEWFIKNGFIGRTDALKDKETVVGGLRELIDSKSTIKQTERVWLNFTKSSQHEERGESAKGKLIAHARIFCNLVDEDKFFKMIASPPFDISTINTKGIAIKIYDFKGQVWAAGILTKDGFITFDVNDIKTRSFKDVIYTIFAKSQNDANALYGNTTLSQIDKYESKFFLFTTSNSREKEELINKLFPPTQSPGAYPGFQNPYIPYGYQNPLNPYGMQQQPLQRKFEPLDQIQYAYSRALHHPTATTVSISAPGQRVINQLKHFNDLIPKQSSPAAVRAITLAGLMDASSRAVHTNICNDPYWTSTPNLSTIYPWATLQFLCLKGLTEKKEQTATRVFGGMDSKKALVDVNKYKFTEEWEKNFIAELKGIYAESPKLKITESTVGILPGAGPTAITLDRMKFENVSELKVGDKTCKVDATPRVKYKEVQIAIEELHHLYDTHVPKVWTLLNSLILIIQDPETKKELVRLHPSAVSTGESSKEYVEKKATEARTMIAEFYIKVEKAYLKAVKSLELA